MPQLPLDAQHPAAEMPISEMGSQLGAGGGGGMHIPLPRGGGELVPQTLPPGSAQHAVAPNPGNIIGGAVHIFVPHCTGAAPAAPPGEPPMPDGAPPAPEGPAPPVAVGTPAMPPPGTPPVPLLLFASSLPQPESPYTPSKPIETQLKWRIIFVTSFRS